MPTTTYDTFFDSLTRLPLLEPGPREALSSLVDEIAQPRALAQELLRRGWLTSFQVNQILQGQGDDLVLGAYILINKIGEGGMGQVFKARRNTDSRIVAIKALRRECMKNSKTVQRFEREMQIASQLRHPHIVRAIDAGQWNGQYFIAMEYIEGADLARRIKREGPMAFAPACDYVRQAALGLQHACDRGLVHRDIKPANLLVTGPTDAAPWGVVKILDLGLARWSDREGGNLTTLGTVMGTPDFIAPEQAVNPSTCDGRADLYSLGCTLYYLLAGRIPFPRGSVAEKLLQHQTQEPEAIELVRRARLEAIALKTGKRYREDFLKVPPEIDGLVRRLMAKRPDDRFRSPADLAVTLHQLVGKPSSQSLGCTPTPTTTRPLVPALEEQIDVTPADAAPKEAAPRPMSWGTMVASSGPSAIVQVSLPRKSRATTWWLVGSLTALLLSCVVYLQGARQLNGADTSPPRSTK